VNSRVALAVFVSLILAVAVGWFAAPDRADTYAYAKPTAAQYDSANTAASIGSGAATTAIILAFMIAGAAGIGLAFFSPRPPKGRSPASPGLLPDVVCVETTIADRRQAVDVSSGRTRRVTHVRTRSVVTYAQKVRGLHLCGVPVHSFVERARRSLAYLHQELEVVLGLLQTVDQQIDRLVRVQAGQYAAQLVQHRGLVGVEQ
jgi:hypothetical protein